MFLSGCDIDVQPLGGGGRPDAGVRRNFVGRTGRSERRHLICSRNGCIVVDPLALSPELRRAHDQHAGACEKPHLLGFRTTQRAKERAATLPPPVLYVLNTTFRATHTFGNQSFDKADIISTPRAKEQAIACATARRCAKNCATSGKCPASPCSIRPGRHSPLTAR